MYSIAPFAENDPAVNLHIIRSHPFACLMGSDASGKPVATQIPLLLQEHPHKGQVLTGHIMKKTDHAEAFLQSPQVLAIFSGVQGYISSTWYQNPASAGTWNYMSVQVSGKLVFTDREGTRQALELLTNHFEPAGSAGHFQNIAPEYVSAHLDHIMGFQILIEEIRGTVKLSQNKSTEEQQRIITELHKRNKQQDVALALAMTQYLNLK